MKENKRAFAPTPWGLKVKMCLTERDMTLVELSDLLREQGLVVAPSTLSAMLRGYRGGRSGAVRTAINAFLGIDNDAA